MSLGGLYKKTFGNGNSGGLKKAYAEHAERKAQQTSYSQPKQEEEGLFHRWGRAIMESAKSLTTDRDGEADIQGMTGNLYTPRQYERMAKPKAPVKRRPVQQKPVKKGRRSVPAPVAVEAPVPLEQNEDPTLGDAFSEIGSGFQDFDWASIPNTAGAVAFNSVAEIPKMLVDAVNPLTGGRLDDLSHQIESDTRKAADWLFDTTKLREQEKEFNNVMNDQNSDMFDVVGSAVTNPAQLANMIGTSAAPMILTGGIGAGAAGLAARLPGLATRFAPKALSAAEMLASNPGKVATIGSALGNAWLNANDTFSDTRTRAMPDGTEVPNELSDRYMAMIPSAFFSLVSSAATGGAAEGAIARKLAGIADDGGNWLSRRLAGIAERFPEDTARIIKGTGRTLWEGGKEGLGEFLEEGGNAVGKAFADHRPVTWNEFSKAGIAGAVPGFVTGGATHMVTGGGNTHAPQAPVQPQQNISDIVQHLQQAVQVQQMPQDIQANQTPQTPETPAVSQQSVPQQMAVPQRAEQPVQAPQQIAPADVTASNVIIDNGGISRDTLKNDLKWSDEKIAKLPEGIVTENGASLSKLDKALDNADVGASTADVLDAMTRPQADIEWAEGEQQAPQQIQEQKAVEPAQQVTEPAPVEKQAQVQKELQDQQNAIQKPVETAQQESVQPATVSATEAVKTPETPAQASHEQTAEPVQQNDSTTSTMQEETDSLGKQAFVVRPNVKERVLVLNNRAKKFGGRYVKETKGFHFADAESAQNYQQMLEERYGGLVEQGQKTEQTGNPYTTEKIRDMSDAEITQHMTELGRRLAPGRYGPDESAREPFSRLQKEFWRRKEERNIKRDEAVAKERNTPEYKAEQEAWQKERDRIARVKERELTVNSLAGERAQARTERDIARNIGEVRSRKAREVLNRAIYRNAVEQNTNTDANTKQERPPFSVASKAKKEVGGKTESAIKEAIEYSAIRVNPNYEEQIQALSDSIDNGEKGEIGSVIMGMPSRALLDAGVENLPLLLGQNKVEKLFPDHNVTTEHLKALPKLLSNPLLIFKSATYGGHVIVVDDVMAKKKGEFPITVIIRKNGEVTFNYIRSVYARKNFVNSMSAWMEKGLLISAQKENATELLNLYIQRDKISAVEKAINSASVKSIPWQGELSEKTLNAGKKYAESKEGPVSENKQQSKQQKTEEVKKAEETKAQAVTKQTVNDALNAEGVNIDAVEAVDSVDELPKNLKNTVKSMGYEDHVEGLYDPDSGKVYIVAGNLTSAERAAEVVRHEVIGHYGLETMAGDTLSDSVTRVLDARGKNKVVDGLWDEVARRQPNLDAQTHAKEVIAMMAERNLNNGIVKRVINAIRRFLHKLGIVKSDVTDAYIAKALQDSKQYLINKRLAQDGIIPSTNVLYQVAYTGTPHVFDKFSIDAIGSGEGAQAHGFGLYFAQVLDTAKKYRDTLTQRGASTAFINGMKVPEHEQYEFKLFLDRIRNGKQEDVAGYLAEKKDVYQEGVEHYRKHVERYQGLLDSIKGDSIVDAVRNNGELKAYAQEARKKARDGGYKATVDDLRDVINTYRLEAKGRLARYQKGAEFWNSIDMASLEKSAYGDVLKVDIPESDVMLDEQLSMKEQSDAVQGALKELLGDEFSQDDTGKQAYWKLSDKLGNDKKASTALNGKGVAGITYEGRKDGRCFVIFDDKAIKILDRATENPLLFSVSSGAGRRRRTSRGGINPNFGTQIDEVFAGKRNSATLGMPSKALLDAGVANVPMRILKDAVEKLGPKHNLSVEQIKKLPELLEHPVMIFKSNSDGGHVIFVKETAKANNGKIFPIMISLRPDGRVTVNRVRSAYARDNFPNALRTWINNGSLISAQKKSAIEMINQYTQWGKSPAEVKAINSASVRSIAPAPESKQDKPLYSLIGERGAKNLDAKEEATTRLDNLKVARDMEKAGKDEKAVKIATGWERGADGKWRYEIPDDWNFSGKNLKEKEFETEDGAIGTYYEAKLDDVVDAPRLFSSYPELKDIAVCIQPLPLGLDAHFSTGLFGDMIVLSSDLYSNTVNLNAERIAEIESSPEYKTYEAAFAEQENENPEDAFERMDKAENEFFSSDIGKEYYDLMWSREHRKVKTIKGWNDRAKSVLAHELQHFIQHKEGFSAGGNLKNEDYRRLAGEVEARNVERRMGMSDEERRNSLAKETEDVAREDQIFIENYLDLGKKPLFSVSENNEQRDVVERVTNPTNEQELAEQRQVMAEAYPSRVNAFPEGDGHLAYDVPRVTVVDNALRAYVDKDIDGKKVIETVRRAGGDVSENEDFYLQESLYTSRVADRIERFEDDFVKPMLETIREAGIENLSEADDYLYARHVILDNVNQKLAEINPDMEGNEALSGMTDEEAREILARHEGNEALERLGQLADRIAKRNVSMLVQGGLLTKEEGQVWANKYKHYVPLHRDGNEPQRSSFWEKVKHPLSAIHEAVTRRGNVAGSKSRETRGRESKRRMGGRSKATNILANIIAGYTNSITRVEKAKVGRSVLDFARKFPNADLWTVDTPKTVKRVNKDTGLVETTYRDENLMPADNVLVVKENGQEHWIVFNKDNARAMQIAQTMKGMDPASIGPVMSVMGKFTRHMGQWMTSRNPVFMLFNFARDVQHAAFNVQGTVIEGHGKELLKNIPKCIRQMHNLLRGDGENVGYAEEFKRAGGETGFIKSFESIHERARELEKEFGKLNQGVPKQAVDKLLGVIDDYNAIVENGVRLAAYTTARENGVSIQQAALLAKEITVNFNRRGNRSTALNALYLFANANIQGHARMATALFRSRKARWTAGALVALGMLMDIAGRSIMGDDDETGKKRWDLISDFDKERYWIIPTGGQDFVKIPMPQGLHVLPNIGRMLSEMAFSTNKKTIGERTMQAMLMVVDACNPFGSSGTALQAMAPTLFRPFAQMYENKSFTGAPLHKGKNQFGPDDPAYKKAWDSTNPAWVKISQFLNSATGGDDVKSGWFNMTPQSMSLLFTSFVLPGTIQAPGQAINAMTRPASERRWKDYPVLSRVLGEAPDERVLAGEIYRKNEELQEIIGQIDKYKKEKRTEDMNSRITDLGDGDFDAGFNRYKKLKSFNSQLQSIGKAKSEARKKGDEYGMELAKQKQISLFKRAMKNDLFD